MPVRSYVNFIARKRKALFALLACINILAIIGLFQLNINPDFDIFTLESSQHQQVLERMNQVFDTSEQIILLIETDKEQLTPTLIRQLRDVQHYLESHEAIQMVSGPAPQKLALGEHSLSLDKDLTEADMFFLRAHYQGMGKLSPIKYQNGKLYAVFTIFPEPDFSNADLNSLEDFLESSSTKYYISGDMYMQQKIIDYILMILMFLPPAALLLVLLVFRTQMGTVKATFLSILPAGIAALWTMGSIGWIGKPVSIITVLAPIFTIVIGSADGLHFISHVQDARSEGLDATESIVETLKMVGIPMIITTVTSMAGFLALLALNTTAIHELATFASLGILLAGVATWFVLPLILTGGIELKRPKRAGHRVNMLKRLWGVPSAALVIVIIIGSIIGFQFLTTEFNQLMIYRDFTAVHTSFEKIMDVNDGSIPIYLLVETQGDPLRPEYGRSLLELQGELLDTPYVNSVVSVYDIYSMINTNVSGAPGYPESMQQVNFISTLLQKNEPDPTAHLLAREQQTARIMVFPKDLKNRSLAKIDSIVDNFNARHPNLNIQVSGVQYLMKELNDSMIAGQTQSLLLAFMLVLALLVMSLRKLKPAVISLLPIAITTIALYGFLGFSGISLNLFTATIFSITIGVGIDYAVHFTSVWMNFRRQGHSASDSVNKAFAYTARPIIANAFGLAIGLSALLLSPLRIHLYMSLLMWVSMTAGVLLSLSFLPTVLRRA